MSTLDPLSLLRSLLGAAARETPIVLRDGTNIDAVLAEQLAQARGGGSNYVSRDLQIEAVSKFWRSGKFETFLDARRVAFGLAMSPWNDRRSIIEDKGHFALAMKGFQDYLALPRQFRKIFQGLVRCYFDYDGLSRDASPVGKENWQVLRAYLEKNVSTIKDHSINPDWVTCILSNKGLFTASPCHAYGKELLAGQSVHVDEIRQLLGISDGSWFTRELIMAQLLQATKLDHPVFQDIVSQLLDLIADNDVLRDRGLQVILNRYAAIPQPPQHVELKDHSVSWWGNPWLPSNQDRWGGVDDVARTMVSNWLKLEFIELFFTKLAEDGLSDTRRVKFWMKYVPSINNIHFALGSLVMNSKKADFVMLREKLKGLVVELQDEIHPTNNAFVMTMGDLVGVEFSRVANAFYGYSLRQKLPFDLSKPVTTPIDGRNSLKNSSRPLYLRHQDNILGHDKWESRFQAKLQEKFGIKPSFVSVHKIARPADAPGSVQSRNSSSEVGRNVISTSPNSRKASPGVAPIPVHVQQSLPRSNNPKTSPASLASTSATARSTLPTPLTEIFSEGNLQAVVKRMGGYSKDNTSKGGALWVHATDNHPDGSRILRSWGFTYVAGKGWWRKPEE